MNRIQSLLARALRRAGRPAALAGLAVLLPVLPAVAQRGPLPVRPVGPDEPEVVDTRAASPFNMAALGDFGRTGVRAVGSNMFCYGNTGIFEPYFDLGCYYMGQLGTAYSADEQMFFEIGWMATAPPSQMPPSVAAANEAGNLIGGGFTQLVNTYLLSGDFVWRGSDRSGAELLASGTVATTDGSCTDFSAYSSGAMNGGTGLPQLLPSNGCKPTWPGGAWKGRPKYTQASFVEAKEMGVLGDDPFAFWRLPAEVARGPFKGNFATFGEVTDHALDILPEYGAAIPGQSGKSIRNGWPLGLDMFFDGFYFNLPTVNNAYFFEVTIVNNSAQVYGQGVTYDSLYFGLHPMPLISGQRVAIYADPSRGIWAFNNPGSGACQTGDAPPAPGFGLSCASPRSPGFNQGAGGIVVLKSPIGDLRNKHLSDPTSPFYDPNHPAADDTITFNHQHLCGYGCYATTTGRSPRAGFGMWSSTEENVLDGRSTADLSTSTKYQLFRPEGWPAVDAKFSRYIPGGWDYNEDGVQDTLFLDSCGSRGCVEIWGDTLPNGYVNSYGNLSVLGTGPFRIEPGDTVGFTFAVVSAPNGPAMNALLDNVVQFYEEFYFGPEAPGAVSPVHVVQTSARTGDVDNAQVSLYLDDAADDFVDPFLQAFAGRIANADPGSELAKLAELNPWLADSLETLAGNNIAAVHVFKSCDGGNTWTDDGNCFGDPVPAEDPEAKFAPLGWLPWRTFESSTGDFPNVITDDGVVAGRTYLYSVVTETRGAEFIVLKDVGAGDLPRDAEGNAVCAPDRCTATEIVIAPRLMDPLARSTSEPSVVSVYVPLSRPAGEVAASAAVERAAGSATVPFEASVTGLDVVAGTYRAVFADQINVVKDGTTTKVIARDAQYRVRQPTETAELVYFDDKTFQTPGDVSIQGSVTEVGDTLRLGFGLVLLGAGDRPLLVSSTLDGKSTTPGKFLSRSDYPGFVVQANNQDAGRLASQIYTTASGTRISSRIQPSLLWAGVTGLADRHGEYTLEWQDKAFGPGSTFQLRSASLASEVNASLAARSAASSSRSDQEAAEILAAAGYDLEAGELASYGLPFVIKNPDGSTVDVVVIDHQSSIVVGQGADTTRVDVPAGVWVPGDKLVLIETFQTDSVVTAKNAAGKNVKAVVVDAGGNPIRIQAKRATWELMVACSAPRPSCDPTRGIRSVELGGSGYIETAANTVLHTLFYSPFDRESVYRIVVEPRKQLAATDGGSFDLSRVDVVPNPYRVYSPTETTADVADLRFTNVPPEGRIRIYSVSGKFVQELNWTPEDLIGGDGASGDITWNMQTRERLQLAYGLYIWVLTTPNGQRQAGKFVVLR